MHGKSISFLLNFNFHRRKEGGSIRSYLETKRSKIGRIELLVARILKIIFLNRHFSWIIESQGKEKDTRIRDANNNMESWSFQPKLGPPSRPLPRSRKSRVSDSPSGLLVNVCSLGRGGGVHVSTLACCALTYAAGSVVIVWAFRDRARVLIAACIRYVEGNFGKRRRQLTDVHREEFGDNSRSRVF